MKSKKCAICKTPFKQYSSTQTVCGAIKCALAKVDKDKARKAAREAKAQRKDTRERKAKLKSTDVRIQLKLTQIVFNKLRKLQEFEWFKSRGLEPECISCGKKNMDWCCSHLKTVGSHGELRFDNDNTKLACNRYCNKALSGNINGNKTTRGYLVGLAERFGKDEADRIIEHCETSQVKKWGCEELIEMRANFNLEIRRIEKGEI